MVETDWKDCIVVGVERRNVLWDFYCKNRLLCYTKEENAIEFKIRGEKRCIFGTGSTNLVCRWRDVEGVEAEQKIVQNI